MSLVVWIDERRVGAATVLAGESPRVLGVADLPVPGELLGWMESPEKGVALGRSLRAAMRNARLARSGGAAIGVVSRPCVVLKRLRFEGAVDQERDLPGMVRLQFVRQLALPLQGAAIDYTLHGGGLGAGGEGVSVIAAAMIGQRVGGVRVMAKAAGLKLSSLGVAPSGLAALAGPAMGDADGPVLAIVPAGSGADYLIVDRGRLTFARTIELSLPHDNTPGMVHDGGRGPDDWKASRGLNVDLLATEAKRTWVSERLSASADPVSAAMVLVPPWVSQSDRLRLAERCAVELGIPCSPASLGELVQVDEPAGEGEPPAPWLFAAAGAAQAWHLGLDAIDLLRERKPPDPNEKRRKAAMAGGLVLVAVLGTAYTTLSAQLRDLRRQRDDLAARVAPLNERLPEAMLAQVQLDFLERWNATRADWLGHLQAMTATLPDRGSLLLTDVALSAGASVGYEPPRGRRSVYDPAHWLAGVVLQGTLAARAASNRIADEWRGRLVGDALYTVSPLGRDMPPDGDRRYPVVIALRLSSGVAVPPEREPEMLSRAADLSGMPGGAGGGR